MRPCEVTAVAYRTTVSWDNSRCSATFTSRAFIMVAEGEQYYAGYSPLEDRLIRIHDVSGLGSTPFSSK